MFLPTHIITIKKLLDDTTTARLTPNSRIFISLATLTSTKPANWTGRLGAAIVKTEHSNLITRVPSISNLRGLYAIIEFYSRASDDMSSIYIF